MKDMEATVSSVGWGWRSQPSRRSISHLWGSSTILERSFQVRLWETVIAWPISLILSTPFVPCFLTDLQSASSANHSLWHLKMKYSRGRMPWQVPLFKYSNVRQVSQPKFHRSVSPCDRKSGWNIHGSATCHADAKTLSQILRPWFKFR